MTIMSDEPVWAPEQVSLCAACAKHPEVKALVESDITEGVCGACASSDKGVFNPARFEPLRNLIRALIRLHFNEEDYNGHWGGTSIDDMSCSTQDNPIIAIATSSDFNDDLIHRITWEGDIYPDPDEGICLYAGNDDRDWPPHSIFHSRDAQQQNYVRHRIVGSSARTFHRGRACDGSAGRRSIEGDIAADRRPQVRSGIEAGSASSEQAHPCRLQRDHPRGIRPSRVWRSLGPCCHRERRRVGPTGKAFRSCIRGVRDRNRAGRDSAASKPFDFSGRVSRHERICV